VLPGAAAGTPVQVGNFSISQLTDPATGAAYAPDKAGKDNNFRGLTISAELMGKDSILPHVSSVASSRIDAAGKQNNRQ
jgi:hypothetical protein